MLGHAFNMSAESYVIPIGVAFMIVSMILLYGTVLWIIPKERDFGDNLISSSDIPLVNPKVPNNPINDSNNLPYDRNEIRVLVPDEAIYTSPEIPGVIMYD